MAAPRPPFMRPPPEHQLQRFPGVGPARANVPMPTLPELTVVTGVIVRKEMGKIGVVIGFDKMSAWDVCRAVDYQLVEQQKMFHHCPELLAVEMALKTLQQNAQQVCALYQEHNNIDRAGISTHIRVQMHCCYRAVRPSIREKFEREEAGPQ